MPRNVDTFYGPHISALDLGSWMVMSIGRGSMAIHLDGESDLHSGAHRAERKAAGTGKQVDADQPAPSWRAGRAVS